MIIQISSGNGPPECEIAVGKFLDVLKQEVQDLQIISEAPSRYPGSYRSVTFSTTSDVSQLQGTVKWVAKSPLRKGCKRKNWFIDVSLFEQKTKTEFSESMVRYQTFRCGGPGGQNVNKVETGVRATHIPTGISVTATEARTQHLNKKAALHRLLQMIAEQDSDEKDTMIQAMWLQHELLQRGNPVRVYSGMDFARIE